ncbi:MAG: hypothetical protein ACKE5M_02965 [Methylophilaceae bacterium]
MNEILDLLFIAATAVIVFTVIYRIMPFKEFRPTKPKFTLFPKYIAKFEKPVDHIESVLVSQEFKKNENGSYSRGKVYGDFSAKAIKLSVQINKEDNQVVIYASFFGILFDTGDIWQVTSDIVNG